MKKCIWLCISFVILSGSSGLLFAEDPESGGNRPAASEETEAEPGEPVKQNSGDPIQDSWLEAIRSGEQNNTRFSNPGPETEEGAADSGQPQSGFFEEEEGPSFIGTAVRFLLLMGLMIGVFYFVTRVLKNKAGITGPTGGPVQVLTSVPLMPGRFLQVVDMAGQMMVLGVSESGVRLLSVIDDPNVSEKLRLWHSNRPQPASSLSWLEGLLKGSDFRFWKDGSDHKESFDDMLQGKPASDEVPVSDLQNLVNLQKKKIRRLES